MSKKSGSWWPWLLGGAAVAGGVAWAVSASAKSGEAPSLPPQWYEKYSNMVSFDSPPNANMMGEVRYQLGRIFAQAGIKYNTDGITWEKQGMKGTFIIDITSLSKEDRAKAWKVTYPGNIYGCGTSMRARG